MGQVLKSRFCITWETSITVLSFNLVRLVLKTVFREGYCRYLALCITSSVSLSIRLLVRAICFCKTHIRVLLDHVGSGNFAWKQYVQVSIHPTTREAWLSSATLKIFIPGEDRTRPELTQPQLCLLFVHNTVAFVVFCFHQDYPTQEKYIPTGFSRVLLVGQG